MVRVTTRRDHKLLGLIDIPPQFVCFFLGAGPMKVVRSLKTLKSRHRQCQVVRRKGRIYVINKQVRKFKARQG